MGSYPRSEMVLLSLDNIPLIVDLVIRLPIRTLTRGIWVIVDMLTFKDSKLIHDSLLDSLGTKVPSFHGLG